MAGHPLATSTQEADNLRFLFVFMLVTSIFVFHPQLPHDPKGPPLAKKPANVASATKALPLQAKAGQQHKSGPLTKLIIDRVSPGDGKTFPQKGDTIDVHYTGKLLKNGHKFDSSRDRGRPISFKYGTGRVIRGWDEGVMQLSLGERAVLRIPSAMG